MGKDRSVQQLLGESVTKQLEEVLEKHPIARTTPGYVGKVGRAGKFYHVTPKAYRHIWAGDKALAMAKSQGLSVTDTTVFAIIATYGIELKRLEAISDEEILKMVEEEKKDG